MHTGVGLQAMLLWLHSVGRVLHDGVYLTLALAVTTWASMTPQLSKAGVPVTITRRLYRGLEVAGAKT